MKKIITLLMSLLLVFTLVACSNNNNSNNEANTNDQPANLLDKINAEGKMVIATESMWAPYTYEDENGNLTGYDVEVARAICEKLGVEAEFVIGEFDGFLMGLDNGVYDTIFNCIDITDERKAKYDFTDPYINTTVVLIVPETNEDIKSFEDLAGKVTTNTVTSSYAGTAESYGATVAGANTFEETINLVLQGRADATINSKGSFDDYMAVHPETPLKIVDSYTTYAGAPVKKGETELLIAMNTALADLKAEGKLKELSIQFFGEDITGE